MLSFDREKIMAEGYSLETPVIVTNNKGKELLIEKSDGQIDYGESLFSVSPKLSVEEEVLAVE